MLKPAQLEDVIESLFTFDVLGRDMMKLRKDVDNVELQDKLAAVLQTAVSEKLPASDDEEKAQIEKAVKDRVLRYVTASKSAKGTGCG